MMSLRYVVKHPLALICLIWLPCSLLSASETQDYYECLIEPNVVTRVGSPVQGVIEKLAVSRGDKVSKGQTIATLNSTVERANLQQATARAEMNGEIKARQADLNLAIHQMERMLSLYKKKMVSTQQRDEARAQLEVASAALLQAKDNLALLRHDMKRNQHILELRTLKSPIDGVIVEELAFPGEFVYDNPVMTIAQLNPLRVEVVLPAEQFGKHRVGAIATIQPELAQEKRVNATIAVVDGLLDSFSGTFGVRLLLDNEDLSITSGQKCLVSFSNSTTLSSSNSD